MSADPTDSDDRLPKRSSRSGIRLRGKRALIASADSRAFVRLQTEKQILEQIALGAPPVDVLTKLAQHVERFAGTGVWAGIWIVGVAGKRLAAASNPRAAAWLESAAGSDLSADSGHARNVVFPAADNSATPERDRAGVRGCQLTPIVGSDGRVLGALALLLLDEGAHSEDLETLATDAVRIAAVAIQLSENSRSATEERALATSDAQFRTMAQHAPVGVFITDERGDTIFVNPTWCTMAGLEPASALGRRWLQAVHPEDRQRIADGWDETVLNPRESAAEFRFLRADGSVTWLQGRSVVLRDRAGQVTGFVGTLADVTQMKRTEFALRDSESRLNLALLTAKMGVWDWDLRSNRVTWSESLYELYRLERASFDGTRDGFVRLIHADDREMVAQVLRRTLEEGTPYELEFRVLRSDGAVLWVYTFARLVREGETPVRIVGATMDITVRKRSEIALRQSERHTRQLLQSLPVALYTCDATGSVDLFNAAAATLWGREPTNAGLCWDGAVRLFSARGTTLAPEDSPTARAVRIPGSVTDEEVIVERPDGTRRHVVAHPYPIQDESGRLAGAITALVDITDRKRDEEELRRRQRIYEGIGDSINYGIWVCDARGGNLYLSASFLQLVGMEQRECAGFGWVTTLHPEEVEPTLAAWKRCVTTGEPWEREYRIKGLDGKWHPLLSRGTPIRDETGEIVYWVGINLDITAFKDTQRELERRTHSLETVNRVSGALVGEFDLVRITQCVVDAGREIAGATFGVFTYEWLDAEGQRHHPHAASGGTPEVIDELIACGLASRQESPAGNVPRRVDDVVTSPPPGVNRVPRRQPLGQPLVRSLITVPVISRSGRVLGNLAFLHPDADVFTAETERILTAVAAQASIAIDNANLYAALQRELEQQRRAELALRASEQQLRFVTDNALVYLAQIDRQYRLRFVNRPYASAFGVHPVDTAGQSLAQFMGERAFETVKPKLDLALTGRRVEFEIEVPYDRIGPRWMRIVYEPERAADGSVVGLIAVLTDVTARKQSEREIEAARDRALAASRAKDDFLAALSHELRTPLNPVLLLSSEAAADSNLPAQVRNDFLTIRKNVELEARLIDDLLDITRITRGKMSFNFEPVDVHSILNDVIATMRGDIVQKRLHLSVSPGAAHAHVRGDAVRLQQVFWNIVKNAVKFTPAEGCVAIRTRNDPAGQAIEIEVVDSGMGMTPGEIARVFEAFSQGDHAGSGGSHRFGGVGLGLAISRMLTEMHQGVIEARSEGRDRGAAFFVRLPLLPDATAVITARAVAGSVPPFAVTEGVKPRRLLLVEDHEPTRVALTHLLRRRGYEISAAGTLSEARTLAEAEAFDVLISDIGLPDGNGYDLMTELRTKRRLAGIALTGYGMDHDIVRSESAGFVAHLTKPVTIQALEEALRTTLSQDG